MGEFFNQRIRDLPSNEVRKLKASTRVTVNRIYGQTKGYLEQARKDFNGYPEPTFTEPEVVVNPQEKVDKMAKAREGKRLKAEARANAIIEQTINPDKPFHGKKGTLPEVKVE